MKNREVMEQILNKIREYDRIMLFRHIRTDGDAIGSTKGLKAILQLTYPEKEVYLIDSDQSARMAFLGPEDEPVPDELYSEALAIALDAATLDRISNQKYALCKELIKIDHHPDVCPYGDLSWVETNVSSTCELIVKFYDTFSDELKINKEAATCLYAGIVTDSGRFRYSETSGDTLRYAGMLLDLGVDTQWIYSNLYLEDFEFYKFTAHLYQNIQMTEHGVAYIYVDRAMQEQFHLTTESAGEASSAMDGIRGCLCWIAFIDGDDGKIRVRLRSRFMHINTLAERYRGGGHPCASGATVYSQEEMAAVIAEADAMSKEYKATHNDWL